MTWDEYYEDLEKTFMGGYHDEKEVGIFRHGMNTVTNCMKARYPDGPPVAKAVAKPSALAEQVGGTHYKAAKIQPVEYIHANGLDYIRGAVVKYVSRDRQKGGVEDIRKAIHFLRILAELEYGEKL